MKTEIWISIVALCISILSAYISYLLFRYKTRKPKIECSILDADVPTFVSMGNIEGNVPTIEKVLQISNRGKTDTPVYVDVHTSSRMILPPKVDTAHSFVTNGVVEREGFYGSYLNLRLLSLPPQNNTLIHFWCLKRHVDLSASFFKSISIGTNHGLIECDVE